MDQFYFFFLQLFQLCGEERTKISITAAVLVFLFLLMSINHMKTKRDGALL